MKLNNTVLTLALLGVLALAALAGGLLPMGNPAHAADPAFPDTETGDRSIPENTPPGVNIGDPVSAADADETGDDTASPVVVAVEFGDTLVYSLSGPDAASFDIDASTGQLITKAPLDFENPHDAGDTAENNTYLVTVTVKDSSGDSDTEEVTISVTNEAEEPGAPAAPTVVSADTDNDATTYELNVIWYPPDDVVEDIISYGVQFKKTTETSFDTTGVGTIVGTTVEIMGLEVDTAYQVRVQATNSAGTGPWSLSGVGSTNKKDNVLPEFGAASATMVVLENSGPGIDVTPMVSATDDNNMLPLTYQLHGPDANSFDLQASTGQIRTKRGVVYDFETKSTLNVTMTVSDRQGGTDATAVTINVTDVPEAPSKPDRPTVRATPGLSTSLDVSWKAPDNTGPAITGYNIRYREGNSGGYKLITPEGTGTTITFALTAPDDPLTPGASYEVYVRAQNGESPSMWSAAGTGRTSTGNSEPRFDDRSSLTETDPTTTRTVAENTRSGQSFGRAVGAVDGNGDTRSYRLVAAPSPNDEDADKFDINPSTGQILTKDPLSHEAVCNQGDSSLSGGDEENCNYIVVVQVWDGLNEHRNEQDLSSLDNADENIIDDEITVTITVSDVAEKPAAPTVTVTSSVVADNETEATLTVTWDRPENMGPAITGYVVECTGEGFTTDNPCPQPGDDDISDLAAISQTYTIDVTPADLTRNNSYRVRVRADNDEGQGTWSSWETQSTSKAGNTLPTFTSQPGTLYVVENAPLARQPLTTDAAGLTVASIQGSDADADSPLTLSLKGADGGLFTIDASTGQIRTKSKLNYEDAECNPDGSSCSYSVRVKLSDPNGGSRSLPLTITVTDNNEEAPQAPAAPRVTATPGSGWSLEVTWNAPVNNGPSFTGYEIRYRKNGTTDCNDDGAAPAWCNWPHTGTGRSAKIATITDENDDQVHLEPRTRYEVQVRALNGEGDSTFADATNWSPSGRGDTGASNERPVFDSTLPAVVMLEVEENTRSGQSVGSAIEATDPDGHRLTYTLEGPGKDSFSVTSAGQIRTRSPLNQEERDEYSLTVKVNDGQRKNNSIAAKSVTITVLDLPEPPSTPRAPTVSGIPGSTDSVRVTWDEPSNPGPAITHYNLRYAVSGSRDAYTPVDPPTGSADRSAVITGLTAGTRYVVQVRAWNRDNRHSDWSPSGTGSPNPDVENRNPAFSSRSHTFSVAENTPPGADVGSLVAALDPDGDTLTYSLEGVDADSFDIIATNGAGQIQTKAALNHEEKASYSVAVRARDGRGGTDAVNVTIRVTDVNTEAPDTPFAPAVTALSSTSLQVSWDAPANTGPPITDYDYRYQTPTDSGWTEVSNTTITGTTITVDGLTPSTSYDVEVRAKNAEGASGWSNPGNGATNEPGANNRPVFTDGTSTTRSVSASASSGTFIGEPITATDADSADVLEYSLEGRDAPSFDINETNGRLRTKSGITLIVGTTYTVVVVADDTKDTARITVSIEATAAPPNRAPTFPSTSTSRNVAEDRSAGTNVGAPVTATDADLGDTLTYSLDSGTDAGSFSINSSSGQIRTAVVLDYETKNSYTVTVTATDSGNLTDTITVTISVTDVPENFGCGTNGAVDASNGGLVDDCEALLRARDQLQDGGARLNWFQGTPIDQWQGITLGGTPLRVTEVDLNRMGLSGTVPADLGDVDRLTKLNLRSNDLSGAIPASLGNLRYLEVLNLHSNMLNGEIPNLSGTVLQELYLTNNVRWNRDADGERISRVQGTGLSGGVPAWLNTMTDLRELWLWGNNLEGTMPDLSRMRSLDKLKLSGNTGLTGFSGANLPSGLRWLVASETDVGATAPNLSGLTSMTTLWLNKTGLSGAIPVDSIPTSVSNLNLKDNSLRTIPDMSDLDNLRYLYLHRNDLRGVIPDTLGDMASIERIWLHENELTGIAAGLANAADTLTHLYLDGNNFDPGTCLPGDLKTSVANNDFDAAGLEACQ